MISINYRHVLVAEVSCSMRAKPWARALAIDDAIRRGLTPGWLCLPLLRLTQVT